MPNTSMIYGLQDPVTFEIRYVGKTTKGLVRPNEHLSVRFYEGKNTKHYPVYRWIRKNLKIHNKLANIVIIQQFDKISNEELNQCEQYWIKYFSENNLLNCTIGGDGVVGHIHNDQTRSLISKKTKNWWKTLSPELNKKLKQNLTYSGQNKIKIIDQYGNEFNSLTEAAKFLNVGVNAISTQMKKNRACKGHIFQRIEHA